MADNLIGFTGGGFVLLAADTAQTSSVLMLKRNEDKIMEVTTSKMMASSGEHGDRVQFCEFIQKNVALYEYRTGIPLSTSGIASFTRNELATALRRGPYNTNLLLAGIDENDQGESECSLYAIDYLASCHKMKFACQGYANYFLLGLLDKHYKPDMTLKESMDLLELCFKELSNRFVLNTVDFIVKIVDKDGCRLLSRNQPQK